MADAWTVDRGGSNRILRAHFGRADKAGLEVETILAGGRSIRFGSQIADAIQMVLVGEASDRAAPSAPRPCPRKCCQHPDGKPVEAIVGKAAGCGGIDWSKRAPFTGEVALESLGIGPEEALDDADFVSFATTRAD